MKYTLLSVALLSTVLITLNGHAKSSYSTSNAPTRIERCSAALNEYLLLRRTASERDEAAQVLERRIETTCEGFRVRLQRRDGQLVGVVQAGG